MAGLLVALPDVFVATHSNWDPVSAGEVWKVVYEALVAPLMAVKEFAPGFFSIH